MTPHRATAASLFTALAVAAQQPAPPAPPTGTVIGHVIAGDTQRPARFADVYLLPKTDPTTKPPMKDGKELRHLMLVQGRTGIDGSFTLRNLAPGDYYVIPHSQGYLVPVAPVKTLEKFDPTQNTPDLSQALAAFPIVHVVEGRTVNVDTTMQRGGVIEGHARFDDGTPVSGQFVEFEPVEGKRADRQEMGNAFSSINFEERRIVTDDQGRFRLTALAPGKYLVYMEMWPEMDERTTGTSRSWSAQGNPLSQIVTVYSPNTFRKADAKPIEIRADETHTDIDITVKLAGLHTVRGRLLGGDDHHPVNFGFMSLSDDGGFNSGSRVDTDGTFHFNFVPEGTYKLSVEIAGDVRSDSPNSMDPHTVYAKAEQSVIVGEHDVLVDDIQLPAAKDKPAKQP